MKWRFIAKITAASFFGAMLLSVLSLAGFVQLADNITEGYRSAFLENIARGVERAAAERTLFQVKLDADRPFPHPGFGQREDRRFPPDQQHHGRRMPPPHEGFDRRAGGRPPHGGGMRGPGGRPSLWLVTEGGQIVTANTRMAFPKKWDELTRPAEVHEIESSGFFLTPKTQVMKLDTTPVSYLVAREERSPFRGPVFGVQAAMTFATVLVAVALALLFTFAYLRRKSIQARKVLGQLEMGDLKARFEIQRFDETAALLLDFNRMADEIERLVNKVRQTETARSELLQDLGHDLRTPLTSLGTTLETLKKYHERLSEDERADLFSMAQADMQYFKGLVEQLTVIASLEVPHYKSTTLAVDLTQLVTNENKVRQSQFPDKRWTVETGEGIGLLGDIQLFERLFKNAYDNASRYARQEVKTSLKRVPGGIELVISDDGAGFEAEELALFGRRRERRKIQGSDGHLSLGLGSVIMKTITESHGGTLKIENAPSGGAILRFFFPSV